MTFRVEALGDQRLDSFDCGHEDLDDWLKRNAIAATGQGTRTYVLVSSHDDDESVVGYFAVAPHLLAREVAPRSVGRGAPAQIPAILLAKLALDRSVQGLGLGSELLEVALRTILDAARQAGGRVVVVDAIDDAARDFYEYHDFQRLPGNDRRLLLKLSSAAKALGVDWP